MAKVLTPDQADAIVPKEARKRATAKERLEQRESEALAELARLNFRVTWHALPKRVPADPLRGVLAHTEPGGCYAVCYSIDGRRKSVSGISAVDALTAARSWVEWQNRLKDDAAAKFYASPLEDEVPPEVRVSHRVVGDTAEVARRRASTERRVLNFETGIPQLVDAMMGDPIKGDINRASQLA